MTDTLLDPLAAAGQLLVEIEGAADELGDLDRLSQAIDRFMAAHWILFAEGVGSIQDTDREPPQKNYDADYARLGKRFPQLGYYLDGFSIEIETSPGTVGDAIDDLADIVGELREVRWFRENVGTDDALAALRFRYESHLWMHILPLRRYLEEMRRDG
jgi:hypothetical protein